MFSVAELSEDESSKKDDELVPDAVTLEPKEELAVVASEPNLVLKF